jgi:regulator of PEP synthase PpsR (kinase-PPPase family)
MNIWTYIYAYSFPFIYEWTITKLEKIWDTTYAYLAQSKYPLEQCSENFIDAIEKAEKDALSKYANEVFEAQNKYDSRIQSLEYMKKQNPYRNNPI